MTRLDQGQLWFAAGRARSPWRHEVQVGPATVSTPRGRFHVIAEADGGATVACLSGRTRVVVGLGEPVVLGPDQTASVSGDGATLVVMDRASGEEHDQMEPDHLGDGGEPDPIDGTAAASASDSTADPIAAPDAETTGTDAEAVPVAAAVAGAGGRAGGADAPVGSLPHDQPERVRLPWLPEVVAVAALLGVLLAAIVVFGRGSDDGPRSTGPAVATTTTTVATQTSTSQPGTSSTVPSTTPPTVTTTPPTVTTLPPVVTRPGTAEGTLTACRRADGGVNVAVSVALVSGGPSQVWVDVGLVDRSGQLIARARGRSGVIQPGGTVPVEVLVPADASLQGNCELLGVSAG